MPCGLRTVPYAPHIISLRSVPGVGACVETLGIFVAGFVEGTRIDASDFIFEIAGHGIAEVCFVGELRHPGSENPSHKTIAALYSLMAGFHKAGADIEIAGPLGDLLPGRGRLAYARADMRPAFRVRQIFEDQLAEAERTKPIDAAVLEQIHMALGAAAQIDARIDDPAFREIFPAASIDPRSASTRLLTHRSGVGVAVLTKDGITQSHCILGHRPLSVGRLFGFPVPVAKDVRSWGEAWIGHSWGGRRAKPEGLEILPDEVAIIHDVSVYRYRIADRTTLGDLSKFTFGAGPSPFPARVWLGMAEQCGEAGNHELAARCCDEAERSGDDAAMITQAKCEAVHWRDWQAWAETRPIASTVPVTKSTLLPAAELVRRIGPIHADRLAALIGDMQFERANAHDHRRRVNDLPTRAETGQGSARFALAYDNLTGRDLIAAKVPAEILAHLGVGEPIPPPARFPEIFTLRCGDAIIWGSVETGCLILLTDPPVAYSVDRH